MRLSAIATAVLSFATTALCVEQGNLTTPLTSRQILPPTFKPAQTFRNVNLVQIVILDKNYVKGAINVVVENIDNSPQNEYYIPFTSRQMERIGGLEVKDRKDPDGGLFKVEPVEFDPERYARKPLYHSLLTIVLVIRNFMLSTFQSLSHRKRRLLWGFRLLIFLLCILSLQALHKRRANSWFTNFQPTHPHPM